MTPRIETSNEKKLVGKRLSMSFAGYKAGELWRSFMPARKKIINNLTNELISVTVYSIFQYIFGTWLPASGYYLDNRPHFEILGHKYKNNDPDSEEEIWIPVKPKNATH